MKRILFLFFLISFISWGEGKWINPTNVNDTRFDAVTGELKASHSNITTLELKSYRIPTQRSSLLDRHGFVLAEDYSVPTLSVWLEGGAIEKVQETWIRDLEILEAMLDSDLSVYKKISRDVLAERRGTPVSLNINVPDSVTKKVENMKLPRIRMIRNSKRKYSNVLEMSHAVGWIDESNSFSTNSIGFERQPKSGIEVLLSSQIESRSSLDVIRDNTDFTVKIINENISNKTVLPVRLSLDVSVQKKIAKLFLNHFKKGVVLLSNVKSGEILTALSFPLFDPSYLKDNSNRKSVYDSNPLEPLANRMFRPHVFESYKYIAGSLKFKEDMSFFESEALKNYKELMGNVKFEMSEINKTPLFLMCLLQVMTSERSLTFNYQGDQRSYDDSFGFWRFQDFTSVSRRVDAKDKKTGITYLGQMNDNQHNLLVVVEDHTSSSEKVIAFKNEIESFLKSQQYK